MVLFPQVTRRRCHDRALADYNFATLADRLANVFFAYEVGRFFNTRGRRSLGAGVGSRLRPAP